MIALQQFALTSFGGDIDPMSASGSWSNVALTYPTLNGTTGAVTLSWTIGGARLLSVNYSGLGEIQYSINGGAFAAYTGPFSLSSGQSVNWRYSSLGENDPGKTLTVRDATRDVAVGNTFQVSASGWP